MTENEAIRELRLLKPVDQDYAIGGISNASGLAVEMAIQALEEIQQYRAIETELRERYHANVDIKMIMQHFIETIFKGEKHEGFCILTNEDAKMWDAYRAIGTVEEFKALKEKSVAKKPIKHGLRENKVMCPHCTNWLEAHSSKVFCCYCGRKLDWN